MPTSELITSIQGRGRLRIASERRDAVAKLPTDGRARTGPCLFLGGLLLGALVGLPLAMSNADSRSHQIGEDPGRSSSDAVEIDSNASRIFVELEGSSEDKLLLSAPNPAESLLRDRGHDDPSPTLEQLRTAMRLLTETLHENGLDGSAVLFPQWGFNYRGPAPDFELWVDVEVWPSAPGTLELLARRELFAYSLVEEDLGDDAPLGRVWLSDDVAYGHNAGPDPDEWVAIDFGNEMFLIRVFHSGSAVELIGRDEFVPNAFGLAQKLRSYGLSRESLAESQAFVTRPDLATLVRTALETRCTTVCGPITP